MLWATRPIPVPCFFNPQYVKWSPLIKYAYYTYCGLRMQNTHFIRTHVGLEWIQWLMMCHPRQLLAKYKAIASKCLSAIYSHHVDVENKVINADNINKFTFPAGVRQFRLARRRPIINPAGVGAKLFRRRLAARRKFLSLNFQCVAKCVCGDSVNKSSVCTAVITHSLARSSVIKCSSQSTLFN